VVHQAVNRQFIITMKRYDNTSVLTTDTIVEWYTNNFVKLKYSRKISFLHVKEREHEHKIYWKCTEYKKIHCKGRVHVVGDKVTKSIEHYNHVPNAAKIEAKKVISTLKINASQTTLSTHSVLGNAVMQTIQRVRQKEEAALANPSNFEFSIPDKYRYNSNGELFLKLDSDPTESRILIFTTQQYLDLSECDNWFCDGTFSVAPPPPILLNLLAPMLDYFENTWVGKLDRRGKRKPPKYAITLWNCFSRVIQDVATANNAIEGWHNFFTSHINDALKKEESINRFKIEQYIFFVVLHTIFNCKHEYFILSEARNVLILIFYSGNTFFPPKLAQKYQV
ncbi:Uncharacterized protein FWK35_00020633, partial [Aphis craccivora]